MRIIAVLFSLICYAAGVAALAYLILFVGDLFVPVTLNTASEISPALTGAAAIIANFALLTVWGLQHSWMADPGFKNKWVKIVPASVERSTYVLFVGIFTAILVLFWSPMPQKIWSLSGTIWGDILWITFFTGWTITFISTFLINHFHLFGLQQAYRGIDHTQSKDETFRTPLFYKLVRHPIMTGVFIAVWSAPEMTAGRLIFNLGMTAYIIMGVMHEEKTLIADLGEEYLNYKKTTPSILPGMKLKRRLK